MQPDGYIRIDTKIDQTGAATGLAGLSGQLKGFGTMMATAFAGVAARAVTEFAGSCVELASNLSEVQNVVDVTFGEVAQGVNDFAKTADKAFGLSELSAKKFSSTMGAMVKSMGFTEQQAAEMGKTMTGLAGDMASFYNLDAQTAFDKLRSGIAGETEPLKQLGINLSETNLSAFALSQGITKAYNAMTEAEKVTLRYQYIMQATKDAQGDFTRTSDSLANQTRILAMEFDKLKTTVGQALMPVVNSAVQGLNSITESLNTQSAAPAAEALNQVIEKGEGAAEVLMATAATAKDYVDQLKELEAQGLETADAQEKYRQTVSKLQTIMPELNVTINAQTGLIEQSTDALYEHIEALKKEAIAQALQERYTEIVKAQADAMMELEQNKQKQQAADAKATAIIAQLDVQYKALAQSMGLSQTEAAALGGDLNKMEQYAQMGDKNAQAILQLTGQLGAATNESIKFSDAVKTGEAVLASATAKTDGAADAYKALTGRQLEEKKAADQVTVGAKAQTVSFKDQQKAVEELAKKTDTLKKAIDEQTDAGTLSVATVNDLIDAGYAAAIQIDEETGAVTLNKEAYVRLTQAQYDTQIAKAELAKSNLVEQIDSERAAVEKLAQADISAAIAILQMLGAQEKNVLAYDAQIASLKAARTEIGKYASSVSSGGGKAATAAEIAAEKFKKAIQKIDRALELGQITQAEYWRQYAYLMAEYLTQGTEAWDDAAFDLQRGQKVFAEGLQKEMEKANEKAYDEAVKTVDDIKQAYEDRVRSIQQEINNLTQQIARIDLVKSIRDKMGNETLKFLNVEELKKGNAEITTLEENIRKLKAAGVSDSLLAQIGKLDTATANAFSQYLLGLGDEGFKTYMAAWDERQKLAAEAARAFYQKEMDTLQTEFTDKLTTALQGLGDKGKELGQSVAAGIAAGILSGQTGVTDAVKAILQGALAGQPTAAGAPAGAAPATSTTPHLAKGAVLPPNRPFLAMVGDQTRGTNIEAPLDTMLEAFRGALAESGGAGDVNIRVEFKGQLAQLARVLQPMITAEDSRRGAEGRKRRLTDGITYNRGRRRLQPAHQNRGPGAERADRGRHKRRPAEIRRDRF